MNVYTFCYHYFKHFLSIYTISFETCLFVYAVFVGYTTYLCFQYCYFDSIQTQVGEKTVLVDNLEYMECSQHLTSIICLNFFLNLIFWVSCLFGCFCLILLFPVLICQQSHVSLAQPGVGTLVFCFCPRTETNKHRNRSYVFKIKVIQKCYVKIINMTIKIKYEE